MSVEVTDDLVRHIASLARLALSPQEEAGLKEHFHKILAYIEALQALQTRDVEPARLPAPEASLWREDVPKPSLSVNEALANAPRASPPHFLVPRIVGEDDFQSPGATRGGGGA